MHFFGCTVHSIQHDTLKKNVMYHQYMFASNILIDTKKMKVGVIHPIEEIHHMHMT